MAGTVIMVSMVSTANTAYTGSRLQKNRVSNRMGAFYMSIPKIIHYCWFGSKPLPENCRKLMESWRQYLPDYEIMLWNEASFDITSSQYVRAAYSAGKYAFVSDYVRLWALKQYGGIYFDTDMEVTRNFSHLLSGHSAVFGFESGVKVMTAFMAVQAGHPIICEFLEYYSGTDFDVCNLQPNTVVLTEILQRRGLKINNKMQTIDGSTVVYPLVYFQAYDFSKALLRVTEHTHTIHRCFGSWCSPKERLVFSVKRALGNCLSEEGYSRLKRIKKKIMGE